ncbi:head-tail joining protein [Acidisoma sp. 7E03]
MLDIDRLIIGPVSSVFEEPVMMTRARDLSQVAISGVFDEAYLPLSAMGGDLGLDGLHVTTAGPMLGVQLSAIPGDRPRQGDQLFIRGKTYAVKEVQPDSHGWALLILNRAALEP